MKPSRAKNSASWAKMPPRKQSTKKVMSAKHTTNSVLPCNLPWLSRVFKSSCFLIRGLPLSIFVFTEAIVFSVADYNVVITWNAHDGSCCKNCVCNCMVLCAWKGISVCMVMGDYDVVRIKDKGCFIYFADTGRGIFYKTLAQYFFADKLIICIKAEYQKSS